MDEKASPAKKATLIGAVLRIIGTKVFLLLMDIFAWIGRAIYATGNGSVIPEFDMIRGPVEIVCLIVLHSLIWRRGPLKLWD